MFLLLTSFFGLARTAEAVLISLDAVYTITSTDNGFPAPKTATVHGIYDLDDLVCRLNTCGSSNGSTRAILVSGYVIMDGVKKTALVGGPGTPYGWVGYLSHQPPA